MNWIKGFTYIFEDRNWFNKMLVGSMITAVPFAETVSNGYQMQTIENIKQGNPQPLPEWQNTGKMFGRGFKLWLAVNLFYIPSIVISIISWFIGIPFLLGLILNFFASTAMDDGLEKRGTVFVHGYRAWLCRSICNFGTGSSARFGVASGRVLFRSGNGTAVSGNRILAFNAELVRAHQIRSAKLGQLRHFAAQRCGNDLGNANRFVNHRRGNFLDCRTRISAGLVRASRRPLLVTVGMGIFSGKYADETAKFQN